MPGMTLKIPSKSKLHEKIIQELSTRVQMAEKAHSDQIEKWQKAEQLVMAYVPESADDSRRRAARDDGTPGYTTIQIPYSYALLMAAHTYWTSVFLARNPVHQYSGRHGETEMQTQALEAIVDYQLHVGELLAPYYLWIYDVGKYGIGILGEYWAEESHHYSELIIDPTTQQPAYVTSRIGGYVGNKVYNVPPYDFYPDPRIPVRRFQEGEFCAVYREISWNNLIRKQEDGYYTNLDEVKKTPTRRRSYTGGEWSSAPQPIDMIGSSDAKHPAWVGVFEVYVTLIPDEWGLGAMNMPEKWCFTMTSDFSLLLAAHPLGLMHDRYPYEVLETEPEAYSLWTRGIPEIIAPIQETMDWLVNSHFYNVRAIANGRFIYDPSRVDASQLESGEPGWMVALRPEAWGTVTDIKQVFQQVQMGDPTQQHFSDFEQMFHIGERAMGINESIMGSFSGGRKTAAEVRTTTGFGVNRLKTGSEFMSASGFSRHSMKLVQNTQQLLDQALKVRLVGDLMNMAGPQFVMVDKESIAGAYNFVPIDGTQPVDRFAQATLWKDILGQLARLPMIMQQYDMGKIFAWTASLAGLKNIEQMKVQVLPDQQLAGQATAGNVIPYPGGAASTPGTQGNVASNPTTNVI